MRTREAGEPFWVLSWRKWLRSPSPREGQEGGKKGLLEAPWPFLCALEVLFAPQYMEKLSQLAFHPLKMQSCYEKMEPLRLDGLQQRFDVCSTAVFKQRAQIHMREVSAWATAAVLT